MEQCESPASYTDVGDDCDDSAANVSPSNLESCDGLDNDCDTTVDEGLDADLDGLADCYDVEACDGLDNDGDGEVDEDDAVDPAIWFADADGDGYGDAANSAATCEAPPGFVVNPDDCDDGDGDVSPAALESCATAWDDDCDDDTNDLDALGCAPWSADLDVDGFGDPSTTACLCEPDGIYTAALATDCDDSDAGLNPGAPETCDGLDNDCDGGTDEGLDADADGTPDCFDLEACDGVDNDGDGVVDEEDAIDTIVWYADSDLDGFGSVAETASACEAPDGFVEDATDCDDSDSAVNPLAAETCETDADDNCDGETNAVGAAACETWHADQDGDGFGDPTDTVCTCDPVGSYTATTGTDCGDSDDAVHPNALETCATTGDDNCDGDANPIDALACTAFYADVDADGYGAGTAACYCDATVDYAVATATDCDDTDDSVNPGAPETWYDGIDADCDGTDDDDQDGDGYPSDEVGGTDCDDVEAAVYPGASEISDGLDNDCDGLIDNTGTWHTSIIDSTGTTGDYIAIAVEADGSPHISYEDGDDNLQYSYESSFGFTSTDVMTFTSIEVHSNDIGVDSSGYARFLMFDDDDEYVRYSYYTSSGLTATNLDTTTSSPWISHRQLVGLDIDSDDITHAAWYDRDSDLVRYSSGSTSLSAVGSVTVDTVEWLDVAYDEAGGGFGVVIIESDADEAIFYYFEGSSVSSSTIESSVNVADGIALDFDSAGTPHVAYWDDSNARVRYAYLSGSTWTKSTILDFSSANLHAMQVEIDDDDVVHVGFNDSSGGDLYYSYGTAASWTTQVISTSGADPWWFDLALDGWGYPHFAYRDTDNYDAVYTYYY